MELKVVTKKVDLFFKFQHSIKGCAWTSQRFCKLRDVPFDISIIPKPCKCFTKNVFTNQTTYL